MIVNGLFVFFLLSYILGLAMVGLYTVLEFSKFSRKALSFESNCVLAILTTLGWPLFALWVMVVGIKGLLVYGTKRCILPLNTSATLPKATLKKG